MKKLIAALCLSALCSGCDDSRYYEQYTDFKPGYWLVNEKPVFEFEIADNTRPYNLLLTVRNESDYPFANLYYQWQLKDSTGRELDKKLASDYLFDQKTGWPLGNSGLGNIYDHRFHLLEGYTFPYNGKYTLQYEQFMRTDTLRGILAVGLRIERKP